MVLACFGIIVLFMVGVLAIFAYVVPILTTVGGVPVAMVPWVLLAMGVAGFFGNIIGGRLGDWNPTATQIGILTVVISLWLVTLTTGSHGWMVVGAFVLSWLVGFGFPAPIQSRILKAASDAPNFASTLISTAFNVGIAGGAALGAQVLAAGWSYAQLPWLSVAFMGAALVGSVVLAVFEPRMAATQPA